MAYDNTCKFLAEMFPQDLAAWLLDAPVPLTILDPRELSVEPIRADSLILFESDNRILQIEFQTDPDPHIPFRMADYRLRIHRRYPKKEIIQIVIYLSRTGSPLVYQTVYEFPGHRSEFQVIRLWEQPTQVFLSTPGLWPFAALSQTADPEQVLRQVSQRVDQIGNRTQRSYLSASAGILATLVLEKDLIFQILREDIMRESALVQEWLAEGRAEGRAEGEARGEAKRAIKIAINMLQGGEDPRKVAAYTDLSLAEVQQLRDQETTQGSN